MKNSEYRIYSKQLARYRKLAADCRCDHNLLGGVVVLFDMIICSWVREMPSPKEWRPGAVAVADDGLCFKAIGGNDSDGAEKWDLLPGQDDRINERVNKWQQ